MPRLAMLRSSSLVPLLLALAFGVPLSMQQGTCEPFADQPKECTSLIAGDIYIPAGATQTAIAANSLISFTCAVSFRPCDAASLPLPICPEVCSSTVGNCTNTAASSIVANCDTFTDSRGELYFQYGNGTCFVPLPADNTNFTCPPGFLFNGTQCAITCPLPPFSDELSHRRYDYVNWIMTPLSLLCELAIIIPWTYHGIRTKTLHTKYPYFYVICLFCVHLALAMAWGGTRKWRCVNIFTPRNQKSDGLIILQALLFSGGEVAANAWILCLVMHLYIRTVSHRSKFFGEKGTIFGVHEWIVYHVFSWGAGLSTWIAGTSLKAWEVAINGIPGPGTIPHLWVGIGVLPLPVLILCSGAIFLFLLLLWQVWRMAKFTGLKAQWRLCTLCAWYIATIIYASIMYLRIVTRTDEIIAAYYVYLECSLNGGTDCKYHHGILYWTIWSGWVLISSLGMIFFALFFTSESVKQWKDMIDGITSISRSGTTKPSLDSGSATGSAASRL